jgi:hypothetical protein
MGPVLIRIAGSVNVEHYNAHRSHRLLGRHAPSAVDRTQAPVTGVNLARLRRTERLGGLIHEYRMAA